MKKVKSEKVLKYFQRKSFGFTLIELIIVITILAILGIIAFISFQNFSKDARDANRIATLKSIEKGLDLYFVKTGEYPTPDGNILTGTMGETQIMYSGEIGENIVNAIGLNKLTLDPTLGKNYKYGITLSKQEYNLGGIGESETLSQNIISTTYANSYYGQVVGNYKGYIKYSTGNSHYITNVPSLIYTYSGNVADVFEEKENVFFVIKKGENIPYEVSGKINSENPDTVLVRKTGKPNAKFENIDISEIVNTISAEEKKAKIQELLGDDDKILDSFGTDDENVFENIINGGNSQMSSNISTPLVSTRVNGVCGSANRTYSYTDMDYEENDKFCEAGIQTPENIIFPTEGNPITWNCEGSGNPTGTTANCEASKTTTPISGICGGANNTPTLAVPTENLCTQGNPISLEEAQANYTWSCEGINSGSSVSCSALKQYTVTFNSNGGTEVLSQNIIYNQTVNEPIVPIKENHIFEGWYKEIGGVNTWNFETEVITTNTTLYAKWGIGKGEQLYTTPGTYTWTVPSGVTSISVVCVGAGGHGQNGGVHGGRGGGGGGLVYKNNFSLNPGENYVIIVGNATTNPRDSSFNGTIIARGGGSWGDAGGSFTGGDGGGWGGNPGAYFGGGAAGGGGAGGYGGLGGGGGGHNGTTTINGGDGTLGSGGGGGGGNPGGMGGGGVSLYGLQSNGTGGAWNQNGTGGGYQAWYGGGGGGCSSGVCATAGQNGACRIVRPGTTRQFPSTDVGTF